MTEMALGYFETDVDRQPPYDDSEGAALAQGTLTKHFHGDLTGTAVARLIRATSSVPGSGGYVAIERFTGTLHGRDGSFVLQYNAIVNRGKGFVDVQVVPDSGSGALAGLSGTLTLEVGDGKQYYTLTYALGPPA